MKSVIGIYDTYEKAVNAIKQLKSAGFPVKQITIIGQGQIVDGEAHAKPFSSIAVKEISIGAAIGSILGVLTGVSVFAIPGLGFLYGAGVLFGGFAGFEAGMLGGGIAAVLTYIGIEIIGDNRYDQHLNQGNFMLIIHGNQEEIENAKRLLEEFGEHIERNDHE